MSATRLLVLGVVRMYGKAHGYQVRRDLLNWSADKWGNVKPGSIYHALRKMAAEGLLTEVGKRAGGPGRITYRITADGETEFHIRLAKMLSAVDDDPQAGPDLIAAVSFLPALPRKRAIGLLGLRITRWEGQLAGCRRLLEFGDDSPKPAHISALQRLFVAQLEANLGWARDLVDRLERGEYVMADDEGDAFGEP